MRTLEEVRAEDDNAAGTVPNEEPCVNTKQVDKGGARDTQDFNETRAEMGEVRVAFEVDDMNYSSAPTNRRGSSDDDDQTIASKCWCDSDEPLTDELHLDTRTGYVRANNVRTSHIRQELDSMCEEVHDFAARKATDSDKQRREEEMRQHGLRRLETVARAMIGGKETEIGGPAARMTAAGIVEDDVQEEEANRKRKRRRRNPRHHQAIEELLEGEKGNMAALETKRLAFEREKFQAGQELRKNEMKQKARMTERQLELESKKLELQREENERLRHQCQVETDLKFKKLELMMLLHRRDST